MENKKYTDQEILTFNEEEWNQYRQMRWSESKAKKTANVGKSMPENFMKDRVFYINFLKKLIDGGKKISIDPEKVSNMSDSEYNAFRHERWESKQSRAEKSYNNDQVPSWFMKDRKEYIEKSKSGRTKQIPNS